MVQYPDRLGGDRHQGEGGVEYGNEKELFLFCALAACALAVSAQSYSLRSNILGLATTNLNLEASMTLNRKWSLHLPVQYNPFKFGSNRQFRNFYAAPERATGCWKATWADSSACTVRPACTAWGTCSAASTATRGRLRIGLNVGKAYQIGRRWNLEWEVGAGAVWLAYDKYLCKRCGDLVDSDYGWHFLPTRAALNLVYLF